MARARISFEPPAANGTMNMMRLLGYCASAGATSSASTLAKRESHATLSRPGRAIVTFTYRPGLLPCAALPGYGVCSWRCHHPGSDARTPVPLAGGGLHSPCADFG